MTSQQAVNAVLKLLMTGGWLAHAPDEPAEPNATTGTRASGPMLRLGPAVRRL
jgi:hypothetical protein